MMTCCKGKRSNTGHLANNIGIIPHRATSSHHSFGSKIDKRAMINNDTCSETSDDSHVLPYVKRVRCMLNFTKKIFPNILPLIEVKDSNTYHTT